MRNGWTPKVEAKRTALLLQILQRFVVELHVAVDQAHHAARGVEILVGRGKKKEERVRYESRIGLEI